MSPTKVNGFENVFCEGQSLTGTELASSDIWGACEIRSYKRIRKLEASLVYFGASVEMLNLIVIGENWDDSSGL